MKLIQGLSVPNNKDVGSSKSAIKISDLELHFHHKIRMKRNIPMKKGIKTFYKYPSVQFIIIY
jgi:hypothetical protein